MQLKEPIGVGYLREKIVLFLIPDRCFGWMDPFLKAFRGGMDF